MKQKERDIFEKAPVLNAVIRLALPTVIGQVILVIYNMADTYFIGMTGSDAMITAVTICMPAFMFLSAISNLFGVGGSSVIARSLGSGNPGKASRASALAFWGCISVTLFYSLLAFAFQDVFLDLLGGGNPVVHRYARPYLIVTVVLGGLPTALNTFFSHLVRSEGRSLHASVGIAMGGILNVALDPLFMFVILPKGSESLGAALATAVSNTAAMVYFAVILRWNRKKTVLHFRLSRRCFQDHIPQDMLESGLPACLMTLFENISYAILDNLMSMTGTALQAGIGVAKKVNMLAHCIVRGMSLGVLPLIGYNYASGDHKRMRYAIFLSMGISVALASLCMTAYLFLSETLIGIFIQHESPSLHYGARFLRILCVGGPFSACAYAVISFFQAVGQGKKSFVLAILRKGVLDIPLMFLLRELYPVYGIVWATPIADIACCVTAVVLFRQFLISVKRRRRRIVD